MQTLALLGLMLFSSATLAKKPEVQPKVGSRSYVYRARSADTKKEFWGVIPKVVQDTITEKYPRFEYVTACKGSYGGGYDDVVASVVLAGNKTAGVSVFQLENGKIKAQLAVDVASIPLDGTPNDYIETYCDKGEYALRDAENTTLLRVLKAAEPIIMLKTNRMNGLELFALDRNKNTISRIGSIAAP